MHCIAMYLTGEMKLEKNLVAASTVPLVLAILQEGENYGYAIIERVRKLSAGEIQWTDGMLYPVLHWLEDNRYVQTRWEMSDAGRKRKYYFLRSEGRKHLAEQKAQWELVQETLSRAWRLKNA